LNSEEARQVVADLEKKLADALTREIELATESTQSGP
jgi:hypothetical protein